MQTTPKKKKEEEEKSLKKLRPTKLEVRPGIVQLPHTAQLALEDRAIHPTREAARQQRHVPGLDI